MKSKYSYFQFCLDLEPTRHWDIWEIELTKDIASYILPSNTQYFSGDGSIYIDLRYSIRSLSSPNKFLRLSKNYDPAQIIPFTARRAS